jgi:hypothetical protein
LLRKKTERIYIYLFLNMESSNLINKNCLSCSCIGVEIRTDLFVYWNNVKKNECILGFKVWPRVGDY